MASTKMYDLAFAFRETELWNRMTDDMLFAVRLPDKSIGYCSVMGLLGEYIALNLFVGNTGYFSYKLFQDNAPHLDDNPELTYCMDGLQCCFDDPDMLSKEEVAEVRQYAKKHNRRLSGKFAYPQFLKYRPRKLPWHFDSKEDEQRICLALSACLELNNILQKNTTEDIGLLPMNYTSKVPLLSYNDGAWHLSHVKLPASPKKVFPSPAFGNEILAAKIAKKEKTGNWECDIACLPETIQNGNEVPYFPLILAAADPGKKIYFPPVITDGTNPSEMVDKFVSELLVNTCPRSISVRNQRCFNLLKNLCEKTGIKLLKKDKLDFLEPFLANLAKDFKNQGTFDNALDKQGIKMLEKIAKASDKEIMKMSPDFIKGILSMADAGLLPESMVSRIRRLRG